MNSFSQAICLGIFKILINYKSFLKLKIINKTIKGCHITTIFDNVHKRY